ncbi:MAG: hypothetical protein B7C24_06685 [Bacteroidetes bacterium 4572_77]|nr:MAG: hypothetical protein B7C24_06685 [Bacteroidetes bacterium 4572_77]
MQCSRCGYFNNSSAELCIKCNAPLDKNTPSEPEGRKTQAIPQDHSYEDLMKTKMESASNNSFSASKTIADHGGTHTHSSQTEKPVHKCPSCNYHIVGDAKFCPNCSYNLLEETAPKAKKAHASNKPSPRVRKPQKTVNVFAVEEETNEHAISLTELKEKGGQKLELQTEGGKINLNRESLQQEDNPAISENAHAEIIKFEEEWYIINRTSAETTFVVAKKARKIEEGDVILIGNTMYRFKS